MVEKSDNFAKRLTDSELATSIVESANQIWLAGLGAFAMAHEEGGNAFDKFVKHGKDVQERARKSAEGKLDEAREKVAGTWDRLEEVFEGRVARALRGLSVPRKHDIDVLAKRVAELTEAVEALSGKPARPAHRVTPVKRTTRTTVEKHA